MDLASIFNLPPHPHPNAAEQPFFPSIASVPADGATSPPPLPPAAVPLPHPNNFPSYAEMIFAAVKALNERDGSSKRAISRYINAAFPDLPPTHSVLLDKAITNLKKTGHLVLVKKKYKILVSEPVAPSVPLPESNPGTSGKRGRGRPKKQQLPNFGVDEAVDAAVPPPVVSAADVTLVSLGLVEEPVSEETDTLPRKRGRERPKKNAPVKGVTIGKLVGAGSGKRGRPKKSVTAVAMENGTVDVLAGGVKRGRGRPKRIAEGNGAVVANVPGSVVKKRGRGRPRVKLTGGALVGYVGKKRGRPKKAESGSDGGGAVVAGKKRGRPPGRKSGGRPVGRPGKNPLAGSSVSPILGSFTEEDVLRKFEFLQMKIKDALVTLRPQCTGSIGAVDAIQELEGIAVMDFTTVPLVSEAAPFSTEPPSVPPAS